MTLGEQHSLLPKAFVFLAYLSTSENSCVFFLIIPEGFGLNKHLAFDAVCVETAAMTCSPVCRLLESISMDSLLIYSQWEQVGVQCF